LEDGGSFILWDYCRDVFVVGMSYTMDYLTCEGAGTEIKNKLKDIRRENDNI
jgi:hypothetical protein